MTISAPRAFVAALLDLRSIVRHDDNGLCAEGTCSISNTLGMIAAGVGDDPHAQRLGRQLRHHVVGPPQLEAADGLLALRLDIDIEVRFGELCHSQTGPLQPVEWRSYRYPGKPLLRAANLIERYQIYSSVFPHTLKNSAQPEVPFIVSAATDAATAVDGADQCLHNHDGGSIVGHGWRTRVSAVNLANLVKSTCINCVAKDGVQMRQPDQVARLSEEIVVPQKLATVIGSQSQRASQRESGKAKVRCAKARASARGGKENAACTRRDKVLRGYIQLRETISRIRPLSVIAEVSTAPQNPWKGA